MNGWIETVPKASWADAWRLAELSPYFARLAARLDDEARQALFAPPDKALLPDGSEDWLPQVSDDAEENMHRLRQAKARALAHVIWWELGLHGDIAASWTALSDFAAGLIGRALAMARQALVPRYGTMDEGRFAVVGLGKLGGRELNLGSDVDLLFLFDAPEASASTGGRKSTPPGGYFAHLSRMLIRMLDERTADGQAWTVDMRLRPGGAAAPIVMSLDATVDFYRDYGQTWERAMLLKARPVAGDAELGAAFLEGVAPFVHRRYLDYTTVNALADMKRRIDAVAGGRDVGPGYDVKRGAGGIREIEFMVQAMQLLHGGRHPELRLAGTMPALAALHGFGVFSDEDAQTLAAAYPFWRRIEHAIQARRGEQTHRLPDDFAAYLQRALGLDDARTRMRMHAARVRKAFERDLAPGAVAGARPSRSWLEDGVSLPADWNETEQAHARRALERIRAHLARGLLPERCLAEIEIFLDAAMPRWVADDNGLAALDAFADLLKSIGGRATFLDLLSAHAGTRDWLIGVLAASDWVREHLVRDPSLLEWPMQASRGADDVASVVRELDAMDAHDEEAARADLGRLTERGRLIAALAVDAHLADALTLGRWLADVADAATRLALRLALRSLGLEADVPMVALAMGKHGSREMGLMSDLDMVFVLVCEDATQPLDGRTMREQAQRLGRRVIRILSDPPPWGAGYEFDARLRPSGHHGVLVTTLAAFEEYQIHQAQTWEHQALTRARACAGPERAMLAVERVVERVLDMPRDAARLAADVRAMREKMRAHLASKRADIVNLKQDAGGLVDIEFLAQFARLSLGCRGRGVVEILRSLPPDAPEAWRDQAGWLADTWLDYRWMEHVLRVELGCPISSIPRDPAAPQWESLRRHAAIRDPDALRERMRAVAAAFGRLTDGKT